MAKLRIEDFPNWPLEEKEKYWARVKAFKKTREEIERKIKTTITYLKGSEAFLERQKPVPYQYRDLLEVAIETATEIVEALPEDFFEMVPAGNFLGFSIDAHTPSDEVFEKAQKLLNTFIERRKRGVVLATIAKLEDTTGRLPEEAAAYKAKAAELRKSLEITLD